MAKVAICHNCGKSIYQGDPFVSEYDSVYLYCSKRCFIDNHGGAILVNGLNCKPEYDRAFNENAAPEAELVAWLKKRYPERFPEPKFTETEELGCRFDLDYD